MSDREARRRALDPSESFIVQAPAGSGKTELLIQRYLVLLASVDEPEQIIAITFTRKAAAEMRHRIVRALRAAEQAASATEPHRAETLELARAALRRGERLGWSLTSFPRRLGIETLDALNARLARQLPALSGGVAGARIVEDAAEQYLTAARRTVAELTRGGELAAALRLLLGRLDNAVPRLEALLAELLPKREQWLRHLAPAAEAELRADLERALERCVADELGAAAAALPHDVARALGPLLAHAARHADRNGWASFGRHDGGDRAMPPQSLAEWCAVADLLLTRQGGWRRRLDRSIGFGPAHQAQRAQLQDVLDAVSGDDALKDALNAVRALPEPRYSDAEWRTMAALRTVLLHLAAELRVLFAETQAVDFVELALAAESALGRTDAPSELLLALDRRIQHLLVDEFQDTSHSQFRLLETLTAGWEPGDGRTLFLVGDPMQSIYRFRDADMSLFLRVRRHGIGAVRCRSLTLQSNFRSTPEVVGWVNTTFERAFPPADDMAAGAARFSPCVATRGADPQSSVSVHALRSVDVEDELARTVETVVAERRRDPGQSIAVLVRSRTHLNGLQERLHVEGVPVRAVEIDPLNERQVVQDLIGLTRALTHAGDRVAWLAVLRAPWCGLRWQDLEALCGAAPDRSIAELLQDDDALDRVSGDARRRLRRV
ncbi:MAG: UvrD-helicase domain-containing protein, partial [Gammaproteobacteria bacterium]|nr:UvrD-helicase domain-containing protein [Gammaproteobacteria bacterium]